SIDSELLINSQLEINQKNLVSLIKKLILARDINQLTLMYRDPAIKDVMRKYLEELIDYAKSNSREGLEFLLKVYSTPIQVTGSEDSLITPSSQLCSQEQEVKVSVSDAKNFEPEDTIVLPQPITGSKWSSDLSHLCLEEENQGLKQTLSYLMRTFQ